MRPHCTIYEVYEEADIGRDTVILYTDNSGYKKMTDGTPFYVWTKKYARKSDKAVIVYLKDLEMDSIGCTYCVDGGFDAQVIGRGSDKREA